MSLQVVGVAGNKSLKEKSLYSGQLFAGDLVLTPSGTIKKLGITQK